MRVGLKVLDEQGYERWKLLGKIDGDGVFIGVVKILYFFVL